MRRCDVVVVGGGMAGAAAAARAAGQGADVVLVLGRSPDGRAATDQRSGFRLNRGAHALYDRGAGRAVLERLGVAVVGTPPPLERAMGSRGDVVDRLPVGPSSAMRTRLVSRRDTARLAAVLAGARRWRPDELADRTISQWIDGDLGLRGGGRELFATLVRLASYAADHDVVSADVAATQLRTAAGGVTYVHGGWATVVRGLVDRARASGAAVEAGHVSAVEPQEGGGAVVTVGEEAIAAAAVVLAAGGPAANAALLPEAPAAWSPSGPEVAAACLDLGLDHVPPTAVLLGVDRPLYLIRHAPPADLAPSGSSVVHVMRYLADGNPATPAETRRELEDHARLAGVDAGNAVVARYLHRMTVVTAVATPAAGGLRGRPGVDSAGTSGVFVAGDWVGPTGHLVDASLVSGEAAGAAAVAHIRRAPIRVPLAGWTAPVAPSARS